MELFYFYRNQSSESWYDAIIEAWSENPNTWEEGKQVCSYSKLESVHIHICKHPDKYDACRIDHDFGKNISLGHHAKNRKNFLKDFIESDYRRFDQIDYRTFQRLRKVMLNLHRRYPPINYTELLMKEGPVNRILSF